MKTITIIAAFAAATISGSCAMEPDQLIEHTEFLTSAPMPATIFPPLLSDWSNEQLSYAVDPIDEMIGGAPSDEIIKLARKEFNRHVPSENRRKLRLWCLNFYESLSKHMINTGEKINEDALPVYIKKMAIETYPNDLLMQRWFDRYVSLQLEFIAKKWSQIKNEELFPSNAVNAFDRWRKEYRKELTALKATAVKVANKK